MTLIDGAARMVLLLVVVFISPCLLFHCSSGAVLRVLLRVWSLPSVTHTGKGSARRLSAAWRAASLR